jgi:hypothetical protein
VPEPTWNGLKQLRMSSVVSTFRKMSTEADQAHLAWQGRTGRSPQLRAMLSGRMGTSMGRALAIFCRQFVPPKQFPAIRTDS